MGVVLVDREKNYATPSPECVIDVCSEISTMQETSHSLIISRIKGMQASGHADRNAECSFLALVVGACVGSDKPVRSEIDSYFRSCADRMASKQFNVSSEHQLQWCFSRLPLIICDGAQLLYNQLKLQLRVTSEHTRSLSEHEMMDALNSAAAFSNPNDAISKLEIMTRACSAGGVRVINPKENAASPAVTAVLHAVHSCVSFNIRCHRADEGLVADMRQCAEHAAHGGAIIVVASGF